MLQKRIEEYIDSQRNDIIRTWEELVNLEASTQEIESLNVVAEYLFKKFSEIGVSCELHTVHENVPKVLTGVIGEGRPGKPVCFSGHFDTVFNKGSFGEHPFRIEGDKAYGPGVLDMKGGIVISMFVIKALESMGYNDRPIKISFCGDEEGGDYHQLTGRLLASHGEGCICAFNMETGPINNSLCVGRKSALVGNFSIKGVSAHSGNNYEAGRNAIVDAAHKIIAIQNLTDMELGSHMNPAVVHGGTVMNSIPDVCEVIFSGRFVTNKEQDRVMKELEDLLQTVHVEGTSCTYSMRSAMPAYEKTEQNIKLCEFCNETAQKHGYAGLGNVYLGGGSDAAYISQAGIAVLCSCGVRGEWNHTDREYALVESMFERIKLWSAVVNEIDSFSCDC